MSDQQEKKQILTQQPETISPTSDESDRSAIASADSTSAPTETPAEIAAPEDISAPIDEAETIPIAADSAPETTQLASYPPPTIQTANPEPKPARAWPILAVFLSGILVGSVLSLGSLLAWRMYQERANLKIKLPADVPPPKALRLSQQRPPTAGPDFPQHLELDCPPQSLRCPVPLKYPLCLVFRNLLRPRRRLCQLLLQLLLPLRLKPL